MLYCFSVIQDIIIIIVRTHFEAQTQYIKGYRPSEPNTINL